MRDKCIVEDSYGGRTCIADSLSSLRDPTPTRVPGIFIPCVSCRSVSSCCLSVAFFSYSTLVFYRHSPREWKCAMVLSRSSLPDVTITYVNGRACKIYLLGPNILRLSVHFIPDPWILLINVPPVTSRAISASYSTMFRTTRLRSVGTPTFITRDKRRSAS